MNLSHYTAKPIDALRPIEQPSMEAGEGSPYKPRGLWLSVDGDEDWRSWCEGNDFALDTFKHHYRVHLRSDCNVLRLTSESDILDFTDKYNKPFAYPGRSVSDYFGCYIDWPRVAQDYQGIVIAPYCWPLRLDPRTHWYYGWDCASGCIWDPSAIDRFEETTAEPQPEQRK